MAACFAHGRYDGEEASRCMSSLLAMGYRRFELDLYWDDAHRVWSLCPADLPSSDASSLQGGNSTSPPLSTHIGESESAREERVASSCASSIDISGVTSLLLDYFQHSENTIDARLIYVLLNIHASAISPTSYTSLGSHFRDSLSAYIYSPTHLQEDRKDLKSSWYSVHREHQPDGTYYTTDASLGIIQSTPNGWPSEGYVVISKGRRLLLGWGTIDPQLRGYDFAGDGDIIFPPEYIHSLANATQMNELCNIDSITGYSTGTNSSWAYTSKLDGAGSRTNKAMPLDPILNNVSNISSCGISLLLHDTLSNSTVLEDPVPYTRVVQATTWSWALDELGKLDPNKSDNTRPKGSGLRCALMGSSLGSRWRVGDCTEEHHAACRLSNDPYSWRLSSHATAYSSASDACPPDTSFAVPRTGVENAHLYALLRAGTTVNGSGVWLDLNSLHRQACWVTGGQNATCPYNVSQDALQRREVLVTLISGILVLVVAGLTAFVKCSAHRRTSRRKGKRREAGWEYEGYVSGLIACLDDNHMARWLITRIVCVK